ncbi:uncharacterized protein LOC116351436 [Contarinia nasturtii]|uniref:uncharacterized protein LOC116351436 n=1 Tax=Contarinia nasturtii TaxID=265458 RepID=UPI0012D4B46A|nr:uncharacterized protein LOC116351436 [Contarinia nasturtii]XP_031639392.1 uncharacterized protein LOC116351436 [Contarinia nasturtii]
MSDTSSGDDDDGDEECGVERGNVVSNLANNQPVVRLERMSRDLLRQWNVPRPNVTQQTPARRSKRVQTVPSVARSSQPQDSSDDEPLAAKIRRTTQPSNSVSNLANNQPVVRLQRMSNDLLRQWNVPRPSVTQQTPARRSKRVQTVPSVARSSQPQDSSDDEPLAAKIRRTKQPSNSHAVQIVYKLYRLSLVR